MMSIMTIIAVHMDDVDHRNPFTSNLERTSFVMTVYTPSPTILSICTTLSSPVTDKMQSPAMTEQDNDYD